MSRSNNSNENGQSTFDSRRYAVEPYVNYNVTQAVGGVGLTPGYAALTSPGAGRKTAMPQVGLTQGRQAGGVAPGEAPPGAAPGALLGPRVWAGILCT